MNNNKGFTLIELLAVIVILAIIALIATPIILNMINDARKNSAKSSALGYVDSIEYYAGFSQLGSDIETNGYNVDLPTMTNGSVTCTKTSSGWDNNCKTFFEAVDKKSKGKKPDTAIIIISNAGKVQTNSKMTFNGYEVVYDGKDASTNNISPSVDAEEPEIIFEGEIDKITQKTSANVEQKGLIGVAYLDPTDLSKTCNAELASGNVNGNGMPTGIKEGCMKFYIFDESDDKYSMLLDHNTSGNLPCGTKANYPAMEVVNEQLREDTKNWVGETRLIKADEIAHIVGADKPGTIEWKQSKTYGSNDPSTMSDWFYFDATGTTYSSSNGWQKQIKTTKGTSNYAWLYDYTYTCESKGCNVEDSNSYLSAKGNYNKVIYGYWTDDIVVGYTKYVWNVNRYGDLWRDEVNYDEYYGVRPVLIIPKSQLPSNN